MFSLSAKSKVIFVAMSAGLSGVLLTGCSGNPNPEETRIILPGEVEEDKVEDAGDSSDATGDSAAVDPESIIQSFEDLANTSSEDSVPEGVDPGENYQQILERINSSVSTSIVANDISYRLVSVDNIDVGVDKPVKIAIVPEGKPDKSVQFATPSISGTFSGEDKIVSTEELNSSKPSVECDKDSILASPLIVTCSFDKDVPSNSSLLFGFVVSESDDGTEQSIELASIPLNPLSGSTS